MKKSITDEKALPSTYSIIIITSTILLVCIIPYLIYVSFHNNENILEKQIIVLSITVFSFLILSVYYFILIFNRLKLLKEYSIKTKNQINIALKKRKDLIENLINTIKNYINYEKELLSEIGEIRSIDQIKNYIEKYPKLKSNKEFLYLMDQLYFIETEIASLRYLYNNIVQEFNTLLSTFPSNLIGKLMNLKKLNYLNLDIPNSFNKGSS